LSGKLRPTDFGEKLLRAKDFQEAFRIQAEYFQSQLKACAEDATRIGAKMAARSIERVESREISARNY